MQRDIKQTWVFQQSPEMVWEHLTKPELLAQWLMANDIRPVVGHKFNFRVKPRINMGFDGNVYCEVLQVEPFKKLSYSWKGGPGKGKINLDSVVTWTLKPVNNGTELTLEHTGFKGFKNYIAYLIMDRGWRTKIKARITELLKHYQLETANH